MQPKLGNKEQAGKSQWVVALERITSMRPAWMCLNEEAGRRGRPAGCG